MAVGSSIGLIAKAMPAAWPPQIEVLCGRLGSTGMTSSFDAQFVGSWPAVMREQRL
jgi:hypothetical protein